MTDNKIKILTLGDHPLAPSGVGIQSRLFIEGLLETVDRPYAAGGKWEWPCGFVDTSVQEHSPFQWLSMTIATRNHG